jgi:hypothetical protein
MRLVFNVIPSNNNPSSKIGHSFLKKINLFFQLRTNKKEEHWLKKDLRKTQDNTSNCA